MKSDNSEYLEIMKICYLNKVFVIKNNKEKLRVEKTIDNVKSVNFEENEKSLIKKILLYYLNSSHIISSNPFRYNGENIIMKYNINNGLYEFENTKDKSPITELNYSFNNQSFVYYKVNDVLDKNKDFFKRFIKIGSTAMITVFISSSIFLSSIPIAFKNSITFKSDFYLDSNFKSKNFYQNSDEDVNKMLEAILNNNHLTNDEKNFMLGLKNELIENKEYINFKELENDLSELQIKYYSAHPDASNPISTIMYPSAGQYSYIGNDKNIIELFGDMDYETEDLVSCDKTTLIHEANHLLNNELKVMNVGGDFGQMLVPLYLKLGVDDFQLSEMVNELFAREYQYDFNVKEVSNGYYWNMPIAYCLAEIMDEDTLRYFKFNSDSYYLTDYFEKLGVPLEDICEFYVRVNNNFELYEKSEYRLATDLDRELFNENRRRILEILNEMYEKKYNDNMYSNINIKSYLYNSIYVDEDFNNQYLNDLSVDKVESIIPKGYFSETYKTQNPSVKVIVDENEIINFENNTNGLGIK